jgi:serine O-acetyltransferase
MSIRSCRLGESFREPDDWNIAPIVAELRTLREASLAARRRAGRPVKLPSRKVLSGIVEGLNAALFPNRLGSRELTDGSIDYYVGRVLDIALRELVDQIERELQFVSGDEPTNGAQREQAVALVHDFARALPMVRKRLESDIQTAYAADPAARTIDEVLACYPGIKAITHYRLAHELHSLGAPLTARIIGEIGHSLTGVDIHPGARIGNGFFIDHGTGVVIGETCVIGERVQVSHGVTLGAGRLGNDQFTGETRADARHPRVEDDVVIYAGATILGPVTIGRGSIIGGNVWLTDSVPAGSMVSQAKLSTEDFEAGSGI